MVSLTTLLILLAVLLPLPPTEVDADQAKLARRLDEWVDGVHGTWGHD